MQKVHTHSVNIRYIRKTIQIVEDERILNKANTYFVLTLSGSIVSNMYSAQRFALTPI